MLPLLRPSECGLTASVVSQYRYKYDYIMGLPSAKTALGGRGIGLEGVKVGNVSIATLGTEYGDGHFGATISKGLALAMGIGTRKMDRERAMSHTGSSFLVVCTEKNRAA